VIAATMKIHIEITFACRSVSQSSGK